MGNPLHILAGILVIVLYSQFHFVLSYGRGYDACDRNWPLHGTNHPGDAGGYSAVISDETERNIPLTWMNNRSYRIIITGRSFYGLIAAPFRQRDAEVSGWQSPLFGSLQPYPGNTQLRPMRNCPGGLTQSNNVGKTTATFLWRPPPENSTVTIWIVVSRTWTGDNYEMKVELPHYTGEGEEEGGSGAGPGAGGDTSLSGSVAAGDAELSWRVSGAPKSLELTLHFSGRVWLSICRAQALSMLFPSAGHCVIGLPPRSGEVFLDATVMKEEDKHSEEPITQPQNPDKGLLGLYVMRGYSLSSVRQLPFWGSGVANASISFDGRITKLKLHRQLQQLHGEPPELAIQERGQSLILWARGDSINLNYHVRRGVVPISIAGRRPGECSARLCSFRGSCDDHGLCVCSKGYQGPNCEDCEEFYARAGSACEIKPQFRQILLTYRGIADKFFVDPLSKEEASLDVDNMLSQTFSKYLNLPNDRIRIRVVEDVNYGGRRLDLYDNNEENNIFTIQKKKGTFLSPKNFSFITTFGTISTIQASTHLDEATINSRRTQHYIPILMHVNITPTAFPDLFPTSSDIALQVSALRSNEAVLSSLLEGSTVQFQVDEAPQMDYFISNEVFYGLACSDDPTSRNCAYTHWRQLSRRLAVAWNVSTSREESPQNQLNSHVVILSMQMAFKSSSIQDRSWFGVGVNARPRMHGSEAVLVEPGRAPGAQVTRVSIHGYRMSNVVPLSNDSSFLLGTVLEGSARVLASLFAASEHLELFSNSEHLFIASFEWILPMESLRIPGIPPDSDDEIFTHLIHAWGLPGQLTMGPHSSRQAGTELLELRSNSVLQKRQASTLVIVSHALVMIVAFALLVPRSWLYLLPPIGNRTYLERLETHFSLNALWNVLYSETVDLLVLFAILGVLFSVSFSGIQGTLDNIRFGVSQHTITGSVALGLLFVIVVTKFSVLRNTFGNKKNQIQKKGSISYMRALFFLHSFTLIMGLISIGNGIPSIQKYLSYPTYMWNIAIIIAISLCFISILAQIIIFVSSCVSSKRK